jgi:hypothetical protein
MSKTNKDEDQNSEGDLKSSTEKLPQPFKFIATLLIITLPQTSKLVQAVVVILFAVLIAIFSLAALKGIAGIDFFAFLKPVNKTIHYYTISGDIVLKGTHDWSPINSGVELTSSKILYTRKEFMSLGYFKLTWIIRFPETELKSGETDLLLTQKTLSGVDRFMAKSQIKYSSLYNPAQPYRWVHFVVDTTISEDNISIELPD